MADYAAEQAEELEALSAILMDEFGPLEGPLPQGWPSGTKAYRVLVTPTSGADAGEAASAHAKQLDVVFAHTPTYPDEPPLLKPRSVRGLSDAELAEVAKVIDEQVEANGGMAMIFSVVSAAQEWLRALVEGEGDGFTGASSSAANDGGGRELTMEEIALAEERAREEEENRAAAARALGTPVTAETFAAWRKRFDAEREAQGLMLGSVYRGDGEGAQAAMCADGKWSLVFFFLFVKGREKGNKRRKTTHHPLDNFQPPQQKQNKKTVEHAAKAAEKRRAGKLTGRAFFQKMDAGSGGVGGVGGADGEEEEEGTSYPSDEEEADADRRAREALLRGESDLLDDDDEGDSDDEDFLDELESKLTTAG